MKSVFSYPKWEEIPNINLYLDQVLLYVNQICPPVSPDKEKGLTNRPFDCYHNTQVCFFNPGNCSNP